MPLVSCLWMPRHCYAFVTNSDAVLHLKWSGIIDTTARGGEERGQSLQRHGQAGTTAGRPVWAGQARPPQKAEIAATFSAFLMVLFLVPDRYDKMVVLADQSFNRMRMSSAMVGNMATHVRGCRFC